MGNDHVWELLVLLVDGNWKVPAAGPPNQRACFVSRRMLPTFLVLHADPVAIDESEAGCLGKHFHESSWRNLPLELSRMDRRTLENIRDPKKKREWLSFRDPGWFYL